MPAPIHADERLVYVPPLDDNISDPVPLQPASQTTIQSRRIPATSPDPVTARTTTHGGIDDTAGPMLLSTPEISVPSHPSTSKASTSLPDAITHCRTPSPSDAPDISSSPPVVDNTLPTDPLLSSDSPARPGSDHAPSSPESHSSMLAPALPGPPPPRSISAPDLGAAEGDGSALVSSREDKDALGPALAIRKNTSRSSQRQAHGRSSSAPFAWPV
ncbi:hypothetical protein EDB84DRAFT_1560575 [Lactarius hengduanensis]|nr:hypothetical protein EDB84DRAFT_1560575 [Lactarius hengduanensis]